VTWSFDHVSSEHNPAVGREMRMDVAQRPSVEQFLALPNDTEIYAVEIGPFGLGVSMQGLIMSDANRELSREWAKETGNDSMPFQFMFYLLPDGYDITAEMHNKGEGNAVPD